MASRDESTGGDTEEDLTTESSEEERQRRSEIRQTAPAQQPEPQSGAIESEQELKGTPGGPGVYREKEEES